MCKEKSKEEVKEDLKLGKRRKVPQEIPEIRKQVIPPPPGMSRVEFSSDPKPVEQGPILNLLE